jgi:parvulin-like peptidyl-prolyl isomerase
LCAALSLPFGAGCGRKKAEVIARVNGQPITQSDLYEALERVDEGQFARDVLDSLITRQLIRQESQKRDVQLTGQEVELRLEGLKDDILAATGKDYERWLAESVQTEEDLLDQLSVQMLTARLVLGEDAVRQYFEQNRERLAELPYSNESVIFRQIIVATEEEAQAVRNEVVAGSADGRVSGEKFASVAKERSLDHIGRRRGGMAGYLIKGKSPIPEIEEVLFELEPGEVSAPTAVPVPAEEGVEQEEEAAEEQEPMVLWYILMVERQKPAGELTLERNRDVIESWMLQERQYQFELAQFVGNLKAKADVQILAPRYRVLDEVYREAREARQQRLAQPTQLPPIGPAVPESAGPPAGEAPPAAEGE